jgi:hypothetical protein
LICGNQIGRCKRYNGTKDSAHRRRDGEDELYQKSKKIVTKARRASTSALQRRLGIGYARSAQSDPATSDRPQASRYRGKARYAKGRHFPRAPLTSRVTALKHLQIKRLGGNVFLSGVIFEATDIPTVNSELFHHIFITLKYECISPLKHGLDVLMRSCPPIIFFHMFFRPVNSLRLLRLLSAISVMAMNSSPGRDRTHL